MTRNMRFARALLPAAAGLALATLCGSSAQAENRGGPPHSSAPTFSCTAGQTKWGTMATVTLTGGTAGTTNDIDVTVSWSGGSTQTALCGLAFSSAKTQNAPFTPKPPANASTHYTCTAVQASTNNMCATHF